AFVVAAPACVMGAAVDEMRGHDSEEPQAPAAEVFETDLHQHRLAARVGDDALNDAKTATDMRARQPKGGDAVIEPLHDHLAIALLLGEEGRAVCDDEAEVADAGLIDPRVVDFVEDAVADGEPDAAR